MNRFLLLVIGIYLIPHLSLFFRLAPLAGPAWRIPLLLALLTMMATFFIGYALRRHGVWVARPVIALSFFWMAFIFWAFAAGLLMDGWNVLVKMLPSSPRLRPLTALVQLRILVGMTILLFSWSAGEARRLRVRRLELPGLTAPQAVRIAYFSDLHLSPFGNAAAAERAFILLEAVKPDILLCGGDLLDAPAREVQKELEALAAIPAPLGKFAVLGNHEYYAGLSNSLAAYAQAGFTTLRAERVEPLPGLTIAGVDDLHGLAAGDECFWNEDKALPPPGSGTSILLKHKPVVTDLARDRSHLQISGHTHGGQLFPFHVLVRAFFERPFGLYGEGESHRLFVSRGAGTWGPPLRLFAQPEIVLLEIPASDSPEASALRISEEEKARQD